MRQSNYYPFGLKHKGYNNVVTSGGNSVAQKWGYTGKEHQDELGLGWIDITARNYDAALGRWMNIDPLGELMPDQSPYNYAFNNPIFYTDPDGMAPSVGNAGFSDYYDDGHGNIVYDERIHNQEDMNALGIVGEYVGETYYDSVTHTYYDENGISHENMGQVVHMSSNGNTSTSYEWSFWIWLSKFDATGNAVDYVGSGFVLRGQGRGGVRSNNISKNPEDDIEIPAEVVAALRGINNKFKGPKRGKNVIKILQNGIKDATELIRIIKEGRKIIKKEGIYSNASLNSSDTLFYYLQGYRNGGQSQFIGRKIKGLRAAKKEALTEKEINKLDSIKIRDWN